MNLFTAAAVGLGLVLAPIAAPIAAHAIPMACEHRGMAHVERHGGTVKDREYHLTRGERVSCEPEDDTDPHPVETPTAPRTYVPVPVETEEDNDDHHWHIGRDRHRWWRND